MSFSYEHIKEQIKLLEKSLSDYEASDETPISIHWRLGRQYTHLAHWENPIINYHKAIKHFKEVIPHAESSAPRMRLDYYNDTASAYNGLAAFEDTATNLGIAKDYYERAYAQPDKPLEHETGIAINLASLHLGLAQLGDAKSNLHEAVRYSLITINRSHNLMQVVYAKDNLVQAYRELAKLDDDVSLLYKAVEAMQETVDFFANNKQSRDYAVAVGNLATIYHTIARVQPTMSNWNFAEKALKDGVDAYQMAGDVMYATLGKIHWMECKIEKASLVADTKPKLNLYRNVLSIFDGLDFNLISDYPEDLANVYTYAGISTMFIGDKINLDKALSYFKKSIDYHILAKSPPLKIGENYEDISTIFIVQNQRKQAKKFLKLAIAFYHNANRHDLADEVQTRLNKLNSPFDRFFDFF